MLNLALPFFSGYFLNCVHCMTVFIPVLCAVPPHYLLVEKNIWSCTLARSYVQFCLCC